MDLTSSEITRMLASYRDGDRAVLDALLPAVYDELRKTAALALLNERSDHTLQPTALVHEAYLRMVGQSDVEWRSRAHFFGFAAHVMRNILVDHARSRHRAKRGGRQLKVSIDEAVDVSQERDLELIALDDALGALAAFDPQKSRLVELRYFGGLSIEEIQ